MEPAMSSESAALRSGEPPAIPQVTLSGTTVTRVYAVILMVLNGLNVAAFFVLSGVAIGLCVALGASFERVFLLVGAIIAFIIYLLYFRMAMGLRRGERTAVYGIIALSVLPIVLVPLGVLAGGATTMEFAAKPFVSQFFIWNLVGIVILYVPPVVSACRHWDRFH